MTQLQFFTPSPSQADCIRVLFTAMSRRMSAWCIKSLFSLASIAFLTMANYATAYATAQQAHPHALADQHITPATQSLTQPEVMPSIGQRWLQANQQVAAIGGWRSYASEPAPADLPTAAALLPVTVPVQLPQRLPLTPAARAQLEPSAAAHTGVTDVKDTQVVPHE